VPRSCCTHSCLITLGLVVGDISSAFPPLHTGLPHLYHGLSRRPGRITDDLPYNRRLSDIYLSVSHPLWRMFSAADAAYIPPLHRLLIHFIYVWWNWKERVVTVLTCTIPDRRSFPTGRLQPPTIPFPSRFIHFYIPNEM
jgi:hypothetical protein